MLTRIPHRPLSLTALPLLLLAACGAPPTLPTDVPRADATHDTAPADAPPADAPACTTDAECTNDLYCDGAERCVAGACVPGVAPCNDGRSCTRDQCDEAADQCTHEPDHAMCGDPNACNGIERCNPGAPNALPSGCEPVNPMGVLACDDGESCTQDSCDPAAGCVHTPRDLDGDGHVDRACTLDGLPTGPLGDDCNDRDPSVFPGSREVCGDGRDNNCDGRADLTDPACPATNDTCAGATVIPGSGSYLGTTTGLRDDYALSCNAPGTPDAVYVFTTAEPRDVSLALDMDPTARSGRAIALVRDCGPPVSEVRCAQASPFGEDSAMRVRSLPAGTYRVLVENGAFPLSPFRLSVRLDPPTTAPPGDACPAPGERVDPAVELAGGVARTATLRALADDHTIACNPFGAQRDAVFPLTLTAAASDVSITVSEPSGLLTGPMFASLRRSPCDAATSELRCESTMRTLPGGTGLVVSATGLAAGVYWLVIEHAATADVIVRATVTPRTSG